MTFNGTPANLAALNPYDLGHAPSIHLYKNVTLSSVGLSESSFSTTHAFKYNYEILKL